MLKVKQSTNVYGLYREVGRYPMKIARKLITIKYWLKLLNSNNKLIVNIYRMLCNDANYNTTYSGTMRMIEDDYHVLLVCPKYRHLRQNLFTPYFCKWPSLKEFTTLMSSSSPQTLLKHSKFLFLVFKERQT